MVQPQEKHKSPLRIVLPDLLSLPGVGNSSGRRNGARGMDADGRPKVNMAMASRIQMNEIRKYRDGALADLDVPFMRAVEAGDAIEQQRRADLKQELRNITQTFDLSRFRTPATPQAAWPTQLPPRYEEA